MAIGIHKEWRCLRRRSVRWSPYMDGPTQCKPYHSITFSTDTSPADTGATYAGASHAGTADPSSSYAGTAVLSHSITFAVTDDDWYHHGTGYRFADPDDNRHRHKFRYGFKEAENGFWDGYRYRHKIHYSF